MREEINNLSLILKNKLLACKEPQRLLHGRGGCFEALEFLNIDLFNKILIVMLHEPRSIDWEKAFVDEFLSEDILGIVIQDRSQSPSQQNCYGEVPKDMVVEGEGLKYELTPLVIKNPGWFLDMREGRAWVKKYAQNANVLNLFSYTCGFSVVALLHGAEKVVNMDMNKSVLKRGRVNHQINDLDLNRVKFYEHNVLKSFGKIKKNGPYDLLVIDPPSIQTGSFQLRRDYPKLMRRCVEWLSPSAKLLLCCNDPTVDASEFEAWMRKNIEADYELQRLAQPEDYPEKNLARALKVYAVNFL